jgi:hypothetical protein
MARERRSSKTILHGGPDGLVRRKDAHDPELVARSLWVAWADLRDIEANAYTYTHVTDRGDVEERFVYGLAPERTRK